MKASYICPTCGGILSVDDNITLIAQNKHGHKGLVFLHTKLGNYDSEMSSTLPIDSGEYVDFFCPYCHANVDYHKEKTNMAMMFQLDDKGRKSQVLFSKIFGENGHPKKEKKEDVPLTYGELSKKFMDPEWYLS